MRGLLEGQSDGHVFRLSVGHEFGGNDRTTPPEDGLLGVGNRLRRRRDGTHLDISRRGALDETANLDDIAVCTRACPLDAYSGCASGFFEGALDEDRVGFARGCGRSRQSSRE